MNGNSAFELIAILAFCLNVYSLIDVIRIPKPAFQTAGKSKRKWLTYTVLGCLFSVTLFGILVGFIYVVVTRPAISRAKRNRGEQAAPERAASAVTTRQPAGPVPRSEVRMELPVGELTADRRACPWCAESIKSAAIVCRYCGRDVEPVPVSPPRNTSVEDELGGSAPAHDERRAEYAFLQTEHPGSFDVVWQAASQLDPWPKFPTPALRAACKAVEHGAPPLDAVRLAFSAAR
jgi:hypothetical protein